MGRVKGLQKGDGMKRGGSGVWVAGKLTSNEPLTNTHLSVGKEKHSDINFQTGKPLFLTSMSPFPVVSLDKFCEICHQMCMHNNNVDNTH